MPKHQRLGEVVLEMCGFVGYMWCDSTKDILLLLYATLRFWELRRVDEWLHERAELEGQRYNDWYGLLERCLHIDALSHMVVGCFQVTLLFWRGVPP